ncbi:TusE/DsrC/DsvC family sulfur relay protein [Psychroserpens mesophilus]|uniref:TusE/DsrC/DsvC family sulfur relay protein n=1 Tax=Psychroserpens mesophilus TaxID=325473 RepID=UPI0006938C78|nr:TusE/DsrC/DsvC family sulfur relay protein [Psychroserpens mesophilus]
MVVEKIYGEVCVTCNEQGYLTDLNQWTKDIGLEIAKEEGIEMTDKHWEVIDYLRDQCKKQVPLSIRKIGKSGVVSIKEFYQLFPKGPLKISSRIAGIPKPVSCI